MLSYAILVKKFRESRNLSQKELAQKAEIGTGTIGDIERGARNGKISTLNKIAKALALNKEEKIELRNAFIGGETKEKSNVRILSTEDFITIEVKAKASAGNGYINFEENPHLKTIRRNGFHEGCYLIEVIGNSMEPVIQDGAFVIVDPLQLEYVPNKIFIIKFNDEIFIKKIIWNAENNLMILKSVNPEYDDIYISDTQANSVEILGRAMRFIYEGNL
ncbi:XRE family transcriptional regulator [Fusobacterium sp.]|uniref:XRE family transcriptional regulator n=1 Tax=Fusobacterium sp. TaxID=68766 RepID=UPI002900F71F|nr:S24 family peptidase [Fusobacterium sp.]MDU1911081.1 S24 family peptidase [Fusobacterium sp.]